MTKNETPLEPSENHRINEEQIEYPVNQSEFVKTKLDIAINRYHRLSEMPSEWTPGPKTEKNNC